MPKNYCSSFSNTTFCFTVRNERGDLVRNLVTLPPRDTLVDVRLNEEGDFPPPDVAHRRMNLNYTPEGSLTIKHQESEFVIKLN